MDSNPDNYDLGYIQIIKNEEFLCQNNFCRNDKQVIDEEIDGNVRKYYEYFEFNHKNGFICKYKDCEQIEIFENSMVSHVLKHLTPNEFVENKIEVSDHFNNDLTRVSTHDSNQSHDYEVLNTKNDLKINANNNKTGVYVCDWTACKKSFTSWTPFESHKSEHLIQELLENDRNSDANKCSQKQDYEDLEKYFEVINKNGKDNFVCKWKTCDYKSCLLRPIRRHILNDHLNRESSAEEINYWNQFLNNNSTHERSHLKSSTKSAKSWTKTKSEESTYSSGSQIYMKTPNLKKIQEISDTNSPQICPMTSTPNLKTETNEGIEIQFSNNQNVNVSLSEDNVLLSCKGLGSATKVAQYFEKKVISGEKTYFCKWNERCQFKTKRSQKIAEHINIQHIGCEFKCHKPNCNKVFKTPHSWRTHQKNHICGFGLGVDAIGVCYIENILKYRERIIIDDKRSYRCKFNDCNAILRHRSAIKRHIHDQHVCPHRVNLKHSKYKIQYFKTAQTSHSISQFNVNLNNNQMFQCKRYECNAKFAVYSDLRKHQNNLCKYKKVNKNTLTHKMANKPTVIRKMENLKEAAKPNAKPNTKPSTKLNTGSQHSKNITIKKGIVCDSDVKEMINFDSTRERVNKLECAPDVHKYYASRVVVGQNYYLCEWNDCMFTTKFTNQIVQHIQTQHLRYESQPITSHKVISGQRLGKRKHSIHESQHNNNKYQKFDSNKKTLVNQSFQKGFKSSTSDGEVQHKDNLMQYIDEKCIDGEPNYFCKWNDCKYYENCLDRITEHINETHIRFTCDIHNCLKSFKNEDILRVHKINHICGFGIKGRKSFGVCDLDNVRKYLNEQKVSDKYVYSCKWNKCVFVTEIRGIALSHVHNRHICPNRQMSKVKLIQISETNDSNAATNQSLINQKQYTCKRFKCQQKFKTYSDLLKHENILCKFGKHDKIDLKNEETPRDRNEGRKHSFTESLNESTPKKKNWTQITRSYGTETSVENFEKFCKRSTRDGKVLYICIYPNCFVGQKSLCENYKTHNKGNMIRHIRMHCGDKPFVCRLDGCERNFSDSTSQKYHQLNQHKFLNQ